MFLGGDSPSLLCVGEESRGRSAYSYEPALLARISARCEAGKCSLLGGFHEAAALLSAFTILGEEEAGKEIGFQISGNKKLAKSHHTNRNSQKCSGSCALMMDLKPGSQAVFSEF